MYLEEITTSNTLWKLVYPNKNHKSENLIDRLYFFINTEFFSGFYPIKTYKTVDPVNGSREIDRSKNGFM